MIILHLNKESNMWKYAWREIIRRKGRSIAAICSYALAAMILSVLISLFQYSEGSNSELLWMGIIFMIIFLVLHVIRNQYASIVERKREIGILQSMGWTRKRTVLVVGYELILQALLGGVLGGYIAILFQLAVPPSKSSCHILCAVDSFGTMLIGLGIVVTIAALSALCFAFCIARLQPIKNLNAV